jgi:hypothetical protein
MGQFAPITEGAFVLDGPIEFDFAPNGLVYLRSTSGGRPMVLVETIHNFLASTENAKRAYAQWEKRQNGRVEVLPRH